MWEAKGGGARWKGQGRAEGGGQLRWKTMVQAPPLPPSVRVFLLPPSWASCVCNTRVLFSNAVSQLGPDSKEFSFVFTE